MAPSTSSVAEGSAPVEPPGLYFTDPSCLEHDPSPAIPGHPEVPGRLAAIEAELGDLEGLGWERRPAPAAVPDELELIHTPAHVEGVRAIAAAGGGVIDADTFIGEASDRAALHAAGGACAMVRALLAGDARRGFCAVRPPGHHAEPDRSMGFCLFNSIAVAAELAIRDLGAARVLILDWDVHHGNGTAEVFRRRSDVLYVSIHQQGIFPGTGALADVGSGAGEGFTINLPVPAGSGEDVWLSLLEHTVIPAGRAFEPDLLLLSAGFDAHREDPLADCLLETESYARMARLLGEMADDLDAPLGAVLEGGYHPIALARSVRATLTALTGFSRCGSDGGRVPARPPS